MIVNTDGSTASNDTPHVDTVHMLPAEWRDFYALTKPRVMSLVVFTALCGLITAPGNIHPVLAFTAILCIAVGAGASGALNQYYESDIDAKMKRTKGRPLPAGRMQRGAALQFGIGLSGFSVATLGLATNWLAAGILAFAIFFYAVIYTVWLKRATPQNIVIGGAAGAFPPIIGWAAVTGDVTILPILMFLIIFLWTPPHFWALALFVETDYSNAGVPMLPVVKGKNTTRNQILGYALLMAGSAVLPWILGLVGPIYGFAVSVLSALFVALSVRVYYNQSDVPAEMKPEKQLFAYSILYLFLVFALFALDRILTP